MADSSNYIVRKINLSTRAVSTVAGTAEVAGSADGTVATFAFPFGLAVDAAHNLYVSDAGNQTIRMLASSGWVSTVAGATGMLGSADGPAARARFHSPCGLGLDSAGNLLADTYSQAIRCITPAGEVTTVGRIATPSAQPSDLPTYLNPSGIAVDPGTGNLYLSVDNGILQFAF